MKCPGCNEQIAAGEQSCPRCSKRLSDPQSSQPSTTTHSPDPATLAPLWEAARQAIATEPHSQIVEFTAAQLQSFQAHREELAIAWTVAAQALERPEGTLPYEQLQTAGPSAVKSPELAAALVTFQRESSLTQSAQSALPSGAIAPSAQPSFVPADRRMRIAAGVFDLGYIAALSILLTVSIVWFISPELRAGVFAPWRLPTSGQITVAATAAILFIANCFLYPWLSGSRTTGQRIFGLEVRTNDGGPLPAQAVLLRSLLLPLSALLLPFIPPLWRSLGFHNQLCGAVVVKTT